MNVDIIFGTKEKKDRVEKGRSIIDFPNNYIIFDLETTGLDTVYDEIIEIGAFKIQNNEIVDTFHSLINPGFEISDFITDLTGISNDMVKVAPSIDHVLPLFMNFIQDDVLIGHNVNFDINFIYDSLIKYDMTPIRNNYIDTLRISRKILPELNHHRLKDLASYFRINTVGSHRALKDVEITNIVFKNLFILVSEKYRDIEEFKKLFGKKNGIKFSDIQSNVENIDHDSPFFNKSVAITGVLERMQRKDAMQLIANLGGICQDGVNKETNYLVLGNNDYNPILKGNKSSKLIKAENLRSKGFDIEIISENVLYDIIDEYLKD